MTLSQQWVEIERGLPTAWADARLALSVPDAAQAIRATALLASLQPGRSGDTIRFTTARRGAGFGPEHVRKLLRKLDAEKIRGTLSLVSSGEAVPDVELSRVTFVGEWDAALAVLPADWSDLYAEIELVSTDWLEQAALLMGPVNPGRFGGTPGFRFRVASRFGYGASIGMTRRCLERLDEAGIHGELRILRVLSDTRPVATQGPVWYVGGKAV
jgi:hypothetical protein